MINILPKTWEYLSHFETLLRSREKGKFDDTEWYQFNRNQAISVLEQPKIITPEVCFGGRMTIDIENFYHNSKCHTLLLNESSGYSLESILSFLNSTLFWFYLVNTCNVLRGGYVGVKRKVLEPFPVPSSEAIDHQQMIDYSNRALLSMEELQKERSTLLDLLQSKFDIHKPSKKLYNWYDLTFSDFLEELKKAKLTLTEEAEWMQQLNEQKQKAQELKAEIDRTDKKIDRMVYELYGLTEEEIRIVEESTNT